MLMPFSLSSRGARAGRHGADWHQRYARHDTQACFLSFWRCRLALKAPVGVQVGALSRTSERNPGEGSVLNQLAQDRQTAR
ncbi:MAG TPA: hypothetical protein VHZ51_15140 [Ktedonobacteraceae bacterium]|nr:hypothetical protein [Ktedonobacteraceae bacterium]